MSRSAKSGRTLKIGSRGRYGAMLSPKYVRRTCAVSTEPVIVGTNFHGSFSWLVRRDRTRRRPAPAPSALTGASSTVTSTRGTRIAPWRNFLLYGETGRLSPALSWKTLPSVIVKVDLASSHVASEVRRVDRHLRTAFVIPMAGLVWVPLITQETIGNPVGALARSHVSPKATVSAPVWAEVHLPD